MPKNIHKRPLVHGKKLTNVTIGLPPEDLRAIDLLVASAKEETPSIGRSAVIQSAVASNKYIRSFRKEAREQLKKESNHANTTGGEPGPTAADFR